MNEFAPFGWVRATRSDDALELIRVNPLAYTLAAVIAMRARWKAGFNEHGLEPGEALLGDYENYGMSRRQYRTAIDQLSRWGFATFTKTNRGTVGKLISTALFDVVPLTTGHQDGQPQASARPSCGQRPTTNKERKKGRRITV